MKTRAFPKNALSSYKKAHLIKPEEVEPLFRMALVERFRKNYDKAEEYLRQAIAIDDNNPSLHNNLGIICVGQERYMEAIEEFRSALRLNPDNDNTVLNLGLILARTEANDSTAIDLIGNYLEKNPQSKQRDKLNTLLGSLKERIKKKK